MRFFPFFVFLAFAKIGSANDTILVAFSHYQMGTKWQIKAYFYESEFPKETIGERAINLLDSLNAIFSDYDLDSELNQAVAVANTQKWVPISPALAEVIELSLRYSRKSHGAFDISIGPLSRLWRKAFRRQTFPEREEVEVAQRLVNYHWIKVKGQSLGLEKKDMRLDLGGIAKGFAVDQLSEFLQSQGAIAFLVDGGGDLRVEGHPPRKNAWQIALPKGGIRLLTSGAIATSGSTYRYLEFEGKRYSHLIDPRTGYGVQGNQLVTVIATTATEADAWASVFSILSGKKADRLKEKLKPDVEVLVFQN